MITQTELNAIKERAEKATAGPWRIGMQSPNGLNNVGTIGGLLTAQTADEADAEFIAHAREDIPRLVAEIERLNEIIKNYDNTIRNLDALAGSIIYETEYYRYSEMVAEKIIGLITELEKKVGDIV